MYTEHEIGSICGGVELADVINILTNCAGDLDTDEDGSGQLTDADKNEAV